VWLDAGRSDGEPLRDLQRMRNLLDRPGNVVVTRIRPGGHTYGVWRPALRDALSWLTRQLSSTGA
jgi:enterochelin esterase-like enzyme